MTIKEENKEIKKAKTEKKKYKPQTFENGDTLRQLLVRNRYLLFKTPNKWALAQKERADILFRQFDDLKQFYYLNLQLGKSIQPTTIRILLVLNLLYGSTK